MMRPTPRPSWLYNVLVGEGFLLAAIPMPMLAGRLVLMGFAGFGLYQAGVLQNMYWTAGITRFHRPRSIGPLGPLLIAATYGYFFLTAEGIGLQLINSSIYAINMFIAGQRWDNEQQYRSNRERSVDG
jgi:hypothetical protein